MRAPRHADESSTAIYVARVGCEGERACSERVLNLNAWCFCNHVAVRVLLLNPFSMPGNFRHKTIMYTVYAIIDLAIEQPE